MDKTAGKFFAAGSYHLEQTKKFIVYGEMLDGIVNRGMKLSINTNEYYSIYLTISNIDFIHYNYKDYTAFIIHYEHQQHKRFLAKLNIYYAECNIYQ